MESPNNGETIVDLESKDVESVESSEFVRGLRTELDILNSKVDKVEIYENTIESLKRRVKKLQEENSSYVETILEQEEELKKSSSLKNQVESCTLKIRKLKADVLEETIRASKSALEAKRFSKKLEALQKEKDRMTGELKRVHLQLEIAGLEIKNTRTSQEIVERDFQEILLQKEKDIKNFLERIEIFKNNIQEALKNI